MRTTASELNNNRDYVEVGGLRLDGYGWNYKKAITPSLPPVRSAASTMPGRPGRVYVDGADVHDPAEVSITVEVQAYNPTTGLIANTFNGRREQLEDNLQTLLGAIGQPGRQVTYKYVDADGETWTAPAVVISQATIEPRKNNFQADMTFALEIPGVYLRSGLVTSSVSGGNGVSVAGLAGGTAPIYDAIIKVPGPATNPRIEVGGQWVAYDGSVTDWTIDAGAMTSVNGAGSSVIEQTGWSGTNMLVLQPTIDGDGAHSYRLNSTHPLQVTARKARFA